MSLTAWDKLFKSNRYFYGKEANEFIKQQDKLFALTSSIAWFAEDKGRKAVHLANLGHRVTTYDYSVVGLHHTALLAEENNVRVDTIEADLTKVAVAHSLYDGAIMVFGQVAPHNQPFFNRQFISSGKAWWYCHVRGILNRTIDVSNRWTKKGRLVM